MVQHLSWATLCKVAVTVSLFVTASAQKRDLLSKTIDDRTMVTIQGSVRPEVTAQTDRGARPESLPLAGLQLVLHRSPESEAAFTDYLAQLQNPASPKFHKWLTNAQVGTMFGPSAADLQTVTQWLAGKGFAVNSVSPDGLVIEFDETVGLIREAFHAPIHNLEVNGVQHFANVTDPELPEALTPVVPGIAKLNDFKPHSQAHLLHTSASTNVKPKGVGTNGYTYLSAADLATIYGFKPLFAAGITGKGQTLNTTAGSLYRIAFAVMNDTSPSKGYTNVFAAVFGGTTLFSESAVAQGGYTLYSYLAVATSSTTVLGFGARNDGGDFELDSISVTQAPEPSSLILLGTGALGLIGVARRRLKV